MARDYPDLPVQGIAGLHARRQEAVFQTRKQGFTNVNYTYMYMRFRLWAMTWRSYKPEIQNMKYLRKEFVQLFLSQS